MIKVKKVIYTPADIIAMFAVQQKVLDAPAAGYVRNILAITHDQVYNSIAYIGGNAILYGYNSALTTGVFYEQNGFEKAGSYNLAVGKYYGDQTVFSTTKEFYVTTFTQTTAGDSNITAYIIYEDVLI
jgi:hypothetical protein